MRKPRNLTALGAGLLVLWMAALSPAPLRGQGSWFAHYEQALEQIAAGQWEQAIRELEQAVALKPEPELNARTYGNWRPDYLPYFHLGLAHYNLGQDSLALACFARSLQAEEVARSPEMLQQLKGYQRAIRERQPGTESPGGELRQRIEAERERALELERQGALDEARVRFESVLALDPQDSLALAHVTEVRRKLQRLRLEEGRRQALERLLDEAETRLREGLFGEALFLADSALTREPSSPRARELRRRAEQEQARLAGERRRRAQQADSLLAEGGRLLRLDSLEAARSRFQELLRLEPGHAGAGLRLREIEQRSEALRREAARDSLLAAAVRLLAVDSLLPARDRVQQARQLGPDRRADSLLAAVEARLAGGGQLGPPGQPRLVLDPGLPDTLFRVSSPRLRLAGAAYDDGGIERVALVVNGRRRELYRFRGGEPLRRMDFEEELPLARGRNRIELEVQDNSGRRVVAARSVDYLPPFWRDSQFRFFWAALLLLGGGGYFWYRRNVLHMYFNRFRRRAFELITPNPFIVGNPIRTREMFFGREDDFRFVKNKVEGDRYGSLILLFGERRAGKTSVLYQIVGGRLGPSYLPVFIDMQAMAINDDREFLGRLAELTVRAVARPEAGFDLSPFEDRSRNPFTVFDKFIDRVLAAIGPDRLLFLVDEYELIEDKVEEGKISKDIFLFLSGLVEHKEGLFFIFAGTHRLQERRTAYWQPLLQRCDYRNISYLTPNDTRRLIVEPVRGKVFYLGNSVRHIMTLTAGQPFYTQLVCRNIVELLNNERRNYFYEEDIAVVVREIIDNPPPQMIYFWAGLSDREKVALSVLAELSRSEGRAPAIREMLAALAKGTLPMSETDLKKACESLARREVLEQLGEEAYRFRMDLFRLWIREEHNLYRVSREIEHQFSA